MRGWVNELDWHQKRDNNGGCRCLFLGQYRSLFVVEEDNEELCPLIAVLFTRTQSFGKHGEMAAKLRDANL